MSIEKAVSTKESRFIARVLRQTNTIRKRLTTNALSQFISQVFVGKGKDSVALRDRLLAFVSSVPVYTLTHIHLHTRTPYTPHTYYGFARM